MDNRFTREVSRRAAIYEERTGNWLPLNVVAKISTVVGAALFIEGFATSSSTEEGLVAASFAVGGMIVDKATGGLEPYRVDQRETN